MKKLLIISAVIIVNLVSAFPFRTSCNQVVDINNEWASTVTRAYLTSSLQMLNHNICGVWPKAIVYY